MAQKIEYGSGHDAGIAGSLSQRLEEGKETCSPSTLKQTKVTDFRACDKLNSRSWLFAGAEESGIIASTVLGHFRRVRRG